MNEARLTTIEQIEQIEPFLRTGTSIEFSAAGDAGERYEHLCRFLKLKRFDGRGRKMRELGVLLRYRRWARLLTSPPFNPRVAYGIL